MIDIDVKRKLNMELSSIFDKIKVYSNRKGMAIELLEERFGVKLNEEEKEHVEKWVDVFSEAVDSELADKLNYEFEKYTEKELSKYENRKRTHYYAYKMFFMSKIIETIEDKAQEWGEPIEEWNDEKVVDNVDLEDLVDFVIDNLDTQLQNDLESDVFECVDYFFQNKISELNNSGLNIHEDTVNHPLS